MRTYCTDRRTHIRRLCLWLTGSVFGLHVAIAQTSGICSSPPNPIVAENCLPGSPSSQWDISGAGDSTIQGFATDISVNQGGTIRFKISTTALSYRLDIYRMGYYSGNGARLVATVSAAGPQNRTACLTDSATGLIDCGNWSESALWTVPSTAVSGIYFARAVRTDNGGASHIFFIVRNDTRPSDILFQTSDLTWQAYNDYGGNNLYTGSPAGRAYKVSYNRPFHTRVFEPESWVFNAEYPMVRWLEANGYDVTYFTGVDTERHAALIRNHKVWMSNGHDEYWSGGQRASVEAARDAGVHLAFFSGNTMFWKTRWEKSIDGSNTDYRTLVCYKETHANAVIDPADPPIWTGTWRDPRFSPPADAGKPENAIVGTLFRMNGGQNTSITVPQADGRMRFWRNTSVATLGTGQSATLAPGTIGAEFDVDEDNGFRPAGLIELSNTPVTDSGNYLLDYGSTYGAGTAVHKLTIYKAPSGAWVFASGTYQWSWGLDSHHDRGNLGSTTDVRMQQATVNLFADMGVQPAALQAGLTAATASIDSSAPVSAITAPAAGSTVSAGASVTITGTASDVGGVVAGVEVSVDGGTSWHGATGTGNWTYSWKPAVAGSAVIRSRAVDDTGNFETPGAGVAITVTGPVACTSKCSIWSSLTTPGVIDQGPDSTVELGVRFRADVNGTLTGIRFYKASTNTGTHVGNLWSSTGQLLASATFSGETASGWQQVSFSTPVSVTANTVYVASYHANNGHYSQDESYFAAGGVDSPPLHALQNSASGLNGVYAYGATSIFPSQSFNSANYWVDVVFTPASSASLTSILVTPASPSIQTGATQQFTATGTYSDNTTQNITSQVSWSSSSSAVATVNAGGLATGTGVGTATITATLGGVTGNTTLTVQSAPLTVNTTSLPQGTVSVNYSATLTATGGTPPYSWTLASGTLPNGLTLNGNGTITGAPGAAGTFNVMIQVTDAGTPAAAASKLFTLTVVQPGPAPFTVFGNVVPAIVDDGDTASVELGMKFRSDVDGTVTGVRFYKSVNNTGVHTGSLWTSTGSLLATVTFAGETASGWQQANFSSPVPITAGTIYVVSYHAPNGRYAADSGYFTSTGLYNPPLYALRNGVSGANGVYLYGSGGFPNQTFSSSNYYVDVVFSAPATTAVRLFPVATVIESGTPGAGTFSALTADDNTFYQVKSTTSGTRTSAWYGSFTGVPNSLTGLAVSYVGKNSATCTEALSVWNFTTSAWVQINSTSVGTGEVLRSNIVPGGTLSDYVSGTSGPGEVRVRVSCSTASTSFTSSGDLMSIRYNP